MKLTLHVGSIRTKKSKLNNSNNFVKTFPNLTHFKLLQKYFSSPNTWKLKESAKSFAFRNLTFTVT